MKIKVKTKGYGIGIYVRSYLNLYHIAKEELTKLMGNIANGQRTGAKMVPVYFHLRSKVPARPVTA